MPRPLEQFGPYSLMARLGAGGMAETFLATRRGPADFEHDVCVKRILSHLESDESFVRLFLREARLSARLTHSNIAQVVDFGVYGEQHFLALEFIDGCDLRTLLAGIARDSETLTAGLLVHIAVELARALDFASRAHGVVHRDISPSNILVSRAGELKLADFGIAKALGHRAHTKTARARGKLPYMAPEYARYGQFDVRCDLFSLGVTLFECGAGCRPYGGDSPDQILDRMTRGSHPDFRRVSPGATEVLANAIHRLIAPDPTQRFASVREVLDAFADTPPPPTARRILGDLVRRYQPVRSFATDGTLILSPQVTLPSSELPNLSSDVATTPRTRVDFTRARLISFLAGAVSVALVGAALYLALS